MVSRRHSYPQSSILLFFNYMDFSYQAVFIGHVNDRTLRPLICEYYIAHTSSQILSALGPNIFLFCYLFPYFDAIHCTTSFYGRIQLLWSLQHLKIYSSMPLSLTGYIKGSMWLYIQFFQLWHHYFPATSFAVWGRDNISDLISSDPLSNLNSESLWTYSYFWNSETPTFVSLSELDSCILLGSWGTLSN